LTPKWIKLAIRFSTLDSEFLFFAAKIIPIFPEAATRASRYFPDA
jgi:hypothetical protein